MNKICKKRNPKTSIFKQTLLEQAQPKSIEQLKAEEVVIADYQKQFTFEERLQDSQECKVKHPDCVPLIIERAADHKDIKEMKSCKFLFHAQSQTAQAMVRTQKDVQAKQMWFFVHLPNNQLKMIYPQSKLGVLYQRYKRSDGNLYIFYSDKNLVNQTSTFMTVMQILCGILLVIYIYLYFFGINDVLKFFGYSNKDFIINQGHTNNSANITNTVNNQVNVTTSDKIEL